MGDGLGGWGGDKGHGQRRRGRDQRQIIGRTTRIVRGIRITPSAVCLDHRLVGSCLCSAWSTSVVAAGVVGVLDVFTPEVELEVAPVRRGCVLGGLEHLGVGVGLEREFRLRSDGRVGEEKNRGRRGVHAR